MEFFRFKKMNSQQKARKQINMQTGLCFNPY